MNTPAIHQAIRFKNHPEEMSWLCLPDSDLPVGINDLLTLCSSENKLESFARTNQLDADELSVELFNFLEKVILNENNSDEKILATEKFASSQLRKFNYKLLMDIYYPETSTRTNSKSYATIIDNAYQRLNKKEEDQEMIRFSENRKISKRYHQGNQQSEVTLSYTKSAIAIVSALTIFTIVSMAGKFFDPVSPELISENNVVETINTQQMIKVTTLQSNLRNNTDSNSIQATSNSLQKILKNLEHAYEVGDVALIKPILANTPDTQNQTAKQLSEKLETLFEITSERKMVLFDFKWKDVSGTLQGKGRFLSRYKLVGESAWLTREGTAWVKADSINNELKVTELTLENQPIE